MNITKKKQSSFIVTAKCPMCGKLHPQKVNEIVVGEMPRIYCPVCKKKASNTYMLAEEIGVVAGIWQDRETLDHQSEVKFLGN